MLFADFRAEVALITVVALILGIGIGHLLSRYLSRKVRRWLMIVAAVAPIVLYILISIAFILLAPNEDQANTTAMISAMASVYPVFASGPWIAGLLLGYMNPWTRGARPKA